MSNTISGAAVVKAAESAGFTGASLLEAVAISFAEDGSHAVDAVNHNTNGSVDRGLWQINSVHSEYDANSLLSDPDYNAKAAYAISNGGKDFGAWVTFNNGAAQAQISNAAQALAQAEANGAVGGTLPSDPLKPVVSATESVASFLAKLSDPELWKRIGIGAAGVALLIIAAVIIFRKPITSAAKIGAIV